MLSDGGFTFQRPLNELLAPTIRVEIPYQASLFASILVGGNMLRQSWRPQIWAAWVAG